MTLISTAWVNGLGAIAGVLLGIASCIWWNRRAARKRKRIPLVWPLRARPLANTGERQAWRWLAAVFPEYAVMVKLPLTRFTIPQQPEQSEHWYSLLAGVYCTLNVCAADGQIIGCVDLPGAMGLSRGNQRLKQTLLSQCGIAYRVVELAKLPSPVDMRISFLGAADPAVVDRARDEVAISSTRQKLQAAIAVQRKKRQRDTDAASAPSSSFAESNLSSDSDFGSWPQQPDSFIAPLDSRAAGLR